MRKVENLSHRTVHIVLCIIILTIANRACERVNLQSNISHFVRLEKKSDDDQLYTKTITEL